MPKSLTFLTPVGSDPAAPGADNARAIPRSRRRRPVYKPAWLRSFLEDGPIDVSVCIANWNCRDLLRACLESLHDQPQGVSLETIVVDNASSDGAAEMIAREFPEIILVRNPSNRGFGRANNQAAERARGRYLLFLNNDTVIPAVALRRLVDYADAHPEIGLIGPRLRDENGQPQVSYRQRPTVGALLHRTYLLRWTGLFRRAYRRYRRQHFDPTTTRPVEVLMGAAMLLPREVFFACGRWDEDFVFGGDDMELSTRVGRHYPVVYFPKVEITHIGRVSTRQNISYTLPNTTIGFLRYLRKTGCPRRALVLYKLAVSLDLPLQFAVKGLQYLWRRSRGRRAAAAKSLLAFRGTWHFLVKGLVPFWKA